MDHTVLFSIQSDRMVRPDCEYLETFWELRLNFMCMSETVSELERGLLAEEMNDFHRRCLDNDKPGRRHMLPFIWYAAHGYGNDDDDRRPMQLPIKLGTRQYELVMSKYAAKMKELKRRTPNYGARVRRPK